MKFYKLPITILTLTLCLTVSKSYSQFEDIEDHYISAGYGYSLDIVNLFFSTYEENTDFEYSDIGPFHVQYEGIMQENIGFGLELAYSKAGAKWRDDISDNDIIYEYDISRTKITANAKVQYHLGIDKKVDPYGAFGLGLRFAQWKSETDDPLFVDGQFTSLTSAAILARIGVRFMFTENLGAYVEAGAGHGIIVGGLAVKL